MCCFVYVSGCLVYLYNYYSACVVNAGLLNVL